jgi:hypothetical protein
MKKFWRIIIYINKLNQLDQFKVKIQKILDTEVARKIYLWKALIKRARRKRIKIFESNFSKIEEKNH